MRCQMSCHDNLLLDRSSIRHLCCLVMIQIFALMRVDKQDRCRFCAYVCMASASNVQSNMQSNMQSICKCKCNLVYAIISKTVCTHVQLDIGLCVDWTCRAHVSTNTIIRTKLTLARSSLEQHTCQKCLQRLYTYTLPLQLHRAHCENLQACQSYLEQNCICMVALQLVHRGLESCRYCLTGHPADHTTCVSLALGTNMYAHFHKTALKNKICRGHEWGY